MATEPHVADGSTSTPGDDEAPLERVQLTREAHDRLRAELEQARTVLRPSLVKRVQRERLFGDPGVAQFRAEELEMHLNDVDRRIDELEGLLAGVEVVGEGPAPDAVEIGTAVVDARRPTRGRSRSGLGLDGVTRRQSLARERSRHTSED